MTKADRRTAGRKARALGAYLEKKTHDELTKRFRFVARATSRGWKGSKDWLGFGDFVCISPRTTIGGVAWIYNSTTKSACRAHIRKIARPPCLIMARAWLKAGGRIVIASWEKVGRKWECEFVPVTLEMMSKIKEKDDGKELEN